MKKRIVGMLVVLVMICGILPAYAAGGIAPTEETWYVVSHSGDYRVYYYAAVTNNSGEPEKIKDLLFEIRDRADTTIESTAKYKLYPEILEPGQTGWLVVSLDVKDIETKSLIDHYALTITSKLVDDKAARMLIAEAEYLEEDEDENEDMIRTAITNSGTGNAFEITVAMVVRDGEGKLLYIDSAATKDIGLTEGGALLIRAQIKSDIMDALDDAKTEIMSAEAIAYTIEDID